MKTAKWRLLLSTSSLALAAILFEVGLVQEGKMHGNHPDYFHEGYYVYTPPTLIASYTLNAPSLVFSQLVHNFLTRRVGWTESWFPYGEVEYYIIVFAFWWLVGWRIDARGSPRNLSSFLRVLVCLVGAAFAMLLLYGGVVSRREEYGTRLSPVSMALWGLALFAYFGATLVRYWTEDKNSQLNVAGGG
jgi:hypothetical protein